MNLCAVVTNTEYFKCIIDVISFHNDFHIKPGIPLSLI